MTEGPEWRPLSVRLRGSEEWERPTEGVPEHMRPSLRGAVAKALGWDGVAASVQRRLRIPVPGNSPAACVLAAADTNDETFLDIVDSLLHISSTRVEASRNSSAPWHVVDRLESDAREAAVFALEVRHIFAESNSAYDVVLGTSPWGLARRVDPTSSEAIESAAALNMDSGRHLASAWAHALKRDGDARAVYTDVVLAVETAACRVLIPKDPKPSLGKAIAHLRDSLSHWSVAGLDSQEHSSAATLLAMLQLIWQNQPRHVGLGGAPPAQIDQRTADAVLFVGVTLVHWFARGLVTRGGPASSTS